MVIFSVEVDEVLTGWSGFIQAVGAILVLWQAASLARSAADQERRKATDAEEKELHRMRHHLEALYAIINQAVSIVERKVRSDKPSQGVLQLAFDWTGDIYLRTLDEELFLLDVSRLPEPKDIGRMIRIRGSFRVMKGIISTAKNSVLEFDKIHLGEELPNDFLSTPASQIADCLKNIERELNDFKKDHPGVTLDGPEDI